MFQHGAADRLSRAGRDMSVPGGGPQVEGSKATWMLKLFPSCLGPAEDGRKRRQEDVATQGPDT